MAIPVTGHRRGSTTSVRCIDVAALVAASVLRKNPAATVLPFDDGVVSVDLNSRDSVMTNAGKLASIGGGDTNCSAPVRLLNNLQQGADLIIFVSDNESWVDQGYGRGTALLDNRVAMVDVWRKRVAAQVGGRPHEWDWPETLHTSYQPTSPVSTAMALYNFGRPRQRARQTPPVG